VNTAQPNSGVGTVRERESGIAPALSRSFTQVSEPRLFCARTYDDLIVIRAGSWLDASDVRALFRFVDEVILQRRGDLHGGFQVRMFIDFSSLRRLERETFDLFSSEFQHRKQRLESALEQVVVVRPAGLLGAVVQGFAGLAEVTMSWLVFAQVDAALAHLGTSEAFLTQGLPSLERQGFSGARRRTFTERVHEAVALHLNNAGVGTISAALGVSSRTLQRTLQEEGTTFTDVLWKERVERTKVLLIETDLKLVAIAAEVGLSSVKNLRDGFVQRMSETPVQWRAREVKRQQALPPQAYPLLQA
jgi:AraC-like DNA-binding protein